MRITKSNRLILLPFLLIFCFTASIQHKATAQEAVVVLPTFDAGKARSEVPNHLQPQRISSPLKVRFTPRQHGAWESRRNGNKQWRFRMEVPRANGLALLLDRLALPAGALLWLEDAARRPSGGVYTAAWLNEQGKLLTDFVPGSSLTLVVEMAPSSAEPQLEIIRIEQALSASAFTVPIQAEVGFGASLACHPNVNCPTGTKYETEKRGICRIGMVMEEGVVYCTGNLMNNTTRNQRALILSAFHCQDGLKPMYDFWRFDFNFESPQCTVTDTVVVRDRVVGCQVLAGRRESDFLLVDIPRGVSLSFNPVYLGWDRSIAVPSSAGMVHHPRGDIKKVSTMPVGPIVYGNTLSWGRILGDSMIITPVDHHLEGVFATGSFETGSSGAALLNQQGRVVGQLHGGFRDSITCTNTGAYFGRLEKSWEGGGTPATRLKDWLDPMNAGVMSLGSLIPDAPFNLQVRIRTLADSAVGNVSVTLGGSQQGSGVANSQGLLSIPGLQKASSYTLRFSKADQADRGVTVSDVVRLQQHLLGIKPITDKKMLVVADVNGSSTVSVADLVRMRRVILGISEDFGEVPVWQFLPASYIVVEGQLIPDTFNVPIPTLNEIIWEIVALKTGDLNLSASGQ